MRAYRLLRATALLVVLSNFSISSVSATDYGGGNVGVGQRTGVPPQGGLIDAHGQVSAYGPGGTRFDSAGTPHGVSPSSAGVS